MFEAGISAPVRTPRGRDIDAVRPAEDRCERKRRAAEPDVAINRFQIENC